MAKYHVGDNVKMQTYFYLSSALTDPTTITLKVETPSGTISTYTYGGGTVSKTGTGDYYKNVDLTEAGTWKWHWAGTGTVASVDEGELEVLRSEFD